MSEANRVLIQPDSKVPGLEIVAPAGSPVMFRAALEAGADAVYCGLQDETNARNFPGLNFSVTELTLAAVEAKRAGVKLLVAVNTFARAGGFSAWQNAVDTVATSGAYAIIAADLGVLAYAARRWPNLRCHLSVQAAAGTADAIRFYAETFNVRRVVLPRIMAVSEIARLRKDLDHAGLDMELEAFV
ncbi:MAG: peptidase U32 family protein, partial [Asticcacaulis sp.]